MQLFMRALQIYQLQEENPYSGDSILAKQQGIPNLPFVLRHALLLADCFDCLFSFDLVSPGVALHSNSVHKL